MWLVVDGHLVIIRGWPPVKCGSLTVIGVNNVNSVWTTKILMIGKPSLADPPKRFPETLACFRWRSRGLFQIQNKKRLWNSFASDETQS